MGRQVPRQPAAEGDRNRGGQDMELDDGPAERKRKKDVHDSDGQQRVSDERGIMETMCEEPECTREETDKDVNDYLGAEMEEDDHCRNWVYISENEQAMQDAPMQETLICDDITGRVLKRDCWKSQAFGNGRCGCRVKWKKDESRCEKFLATTTQRTSSRSTSQRRICRTI